MQVLVQHYKCQNCGRLHRSARASLASTSVPDNPINLELIRVGPSYGSSGKGSEEREKSWDRREAFPLIFPITLLSPSFPCLRQLHLSTSKLPPTHRKVSGEASASESNRSPCKIQIPRMPFWQFRQRKVDVAGEGPGMGFKTPGGKNRNHKAREEAQKSTLAMALAEGFFRAEGRSPLGSLFLSVGATTGGGEGEEGASPPTSLPSLFCLSTKREGVNPKGTGQAEKQHKFLTWLPNRPRLQPIDPARSHPWREGGKRERSKKGTHEMKQDN
jgi:hypothetical protein